jgi:hypothetical protein
MSLVYLVTSLPVLKPGAPPPLPREELVERARVALEGPERAELERAVLLEEIDETARRLNLALDNDPDASNADLASAIRRGRTLERDGTDPIPDWALMPLPPHVLYRRYFHMLVQRASTEMLKRWAHFSVDLYEIVTGLLADAEKMSEEQFKAQMEGHFDAASEAMIRAFHTPQLGVERRYPFFPRVDAALRMDDFLQMERELDRLRWERLEEVRPSDPFTIEHVLVFYFQLRILERQSSWNLEKGEKLLEQTLQLPDGIGL